MSNIIPFQPNTEMPALFQEMFGHGLTDDLTANVGLGYPYMSVKGKTFKIVDGNEEEVVYSSQAGMENMPAQFIQVVLLKASRDMSKTFYLGGFTDDSHDKPDCSSFNGVKPDPGVPAPQSQACATCRWNEWGSRPVTNEGQESKGKACQDARRVAIAFPDAMDDPMLLRVPPTSLKSLAEYGASLSKKGVPFQAVLTTIWFDHEVAYPKLMFKAARFLVKEEAEEMAKMVGLPSRGVAPDPILDAICAIQSAPVQQPVQQQPQPVQQPQTPPPQASATVQNVAQAQPQPAVPGGMFDTAAAQPAAQQPVTPPPPAATEPPKRRRGKAATAAPAAAAEASPGVVPNGAAHAGVTVMNGDVAQGVDALLGGLPDVPGI